MEFNGNFEKLLDDNGQKRSFIKSGLMIMELPGSFGKLLNSYEQKWRFPKSGLVITEGMSTLG